MAWDRQVRRRIADAYIQIDDGYQKAMGDWLDTGEAFGGKVIRAQRLMHGKTSPVQHDGKTIFGGLASPMTATRYHSLIVEEKTLPADLEVSAYTTERDGTRTIMGLRHRKFPVEGVQFHPESVLTSEGKKLIKNFLEL